MQSRVFNTVLVDPTQKYLVKSSHNTQKIKDEINYYLSLPKTLNGWFPELLDYAEDYSEYTLTYYPYDNLANLFLKSKIPVDEGKKIIEKLIFIADTLHQVKDSCQDKEKISNFYIQKTLERISQLEDFEFLNKIIEPDYLTINEKTYTNFKGLKQKFIEYFNKNNLPSSLTAIHGDFCFSNILYSPQGKIIKLIDPRGSFGSKGIYGDKHYDFAKLMHCLHGKYDYLVNDNFVLEELSNREYNFTVPKDLVLDELYCHYVDILREKGINLEFIYLVEASLFLSMIPLHYENPVRQKMFYLRGLIILNHVINGLYANQKEL